MNCVFVMWAFGQPITVVPKAFSSTKRVREVFDDFGQPPRMLSDLRWNWNAWSMLKK